MKKSISLIATIFMLLIFNASVIAQQGQGRGRGNMDPEEFAKRQTTQMKESLELTAEQLSEVEKLNLEYAEKMKEAREQAGDDREAMRSAMMEMVKAKDVKMKKILTAEQWTKFEAERKERMQNRRGGGGGRRGI
jgi:Spy/CpxP family protein refolding chaperone